MTTPQTVTLLLVDIVDSTGLLARIGHERAEELTAEQLGRLRKVVESHEGTVVNTTGDGLLVSFPAAVLALDAAAAMHRSVAFLNETRRYGVALQVRIALAASDAMLDGEFRGAAAIYTARTEKLVPANETYCTEAVRLLALGRGAHEFVPLGPKSFKGVDEPVVLHRVRLPVADMLGMPETLDATQRYSFVGRAAEWSAVEGAWRRACSGSGELLVIAGEPGVGKTRLCREFALAARREGAIVLHGRCPSEAGQSYAPFTQAFRRLLTRAPDTASLLGDDAAELARILPELHTLLPDLRPPSHEDSTTDRYRLFEAMVATLNKLAARTPMLLVIDDLSWADEPSLQLLRHISATINKQALLVLASYRPADANEASREFVRSLPPSTRVGVGGLTDDEVLSFVEAMLGGVLQDSARDLMTRIGKHVGGNPLFLGEVVPSLLDDLALEEDGASGWRVRDSSGAFRLPAAVGELIRARADQLSSSAQNVLKLGAIVGFSFAPELLLELVELPGLLFVEALEEIVEAGLVRPAPGTLQYEFTHAVVRDAVYESMSPIRRGAEHRRVGYAIEKLFGSDIEPWVELLASQFENGVGRDDAVKAIQYLRRAGRAADRRLAHDHAADFYRRALAFSERRGEPGGHEMTCDILIDLGNAQRRSGLEEARTTLKKAAELAFEISDARRATAAVLGASRGTFSVAGDIDIARVEQLRHTLGLVGPAATSERARLLANLSSELAFDDDPSSAEVASDEALAIARQLGDPGVLVTVLGTRMVALWRANRVEERLQHVPELEALCHLGEETGRGRSLSAMTVCCQAAMEAGDFVTADRLLAWLEETAASLQQPTSLGYAKLRLASRACLAGDLARAEQLADEAYFYTAQAGQPDAEAFHTGQLFTIRFHQGRTDEVIDAVDREARTFPGIVAFTAAFATCAAELDDRGLCRTVIDPVIERLDDIRFDLNWLATLALTANAVWYLRDEKAADPLRRMLEPYRRQYVDNASAFFGSVHHYYALMSAVLEDDESIDSGFTMAIDAHASLRSPPWLARTRLEYATVLAARGEEAVTHARALATMAVDEARRGRLGLVRRRGRQLIDSLGST